MGKFSQPRNGGTPSKQPEHSPNTAPTGTKTPDIWQESRKKAKKSKRTSVLLISLCSAAAVLVLAVIVGIWFFFGSPADDGLILNNVTVAGVNLGGMTQEQAAAAIHSATDDTYTKTDMVVQLPDTTLTFTPAETGVKLDVDAVVAEAFSYGREGTRKEQEQLRLEAETTVHHIALLPYLNLNVTYIRSQLDDYGSKFNSSFTQSTVEVEGTKPILDPAAEGFDPAAKGETLVLYMGTPGRALDIDSLYDQVLDAYSFNQFLVTGQMQEEEKLPDALDIQALYDQYSIAPVDATMDRETFEVTPETYGYGFDLEAAQLMVDAAQYGDIVKVDLEVKAPAVLGDTLADVLFRDVLASYETKHTKDENRNTNLRLACAAVNGLVLEPGDTFDFNKVVGKRTAEAGYKAADAYSSGETVKTLGGGICQVSSTLYYCVLVADLETVTRLPHSYVSSYMPMGMDATVSWGGPEFRFKNNTNYPIRIEAEVSDGMVKVKLIGTDEKDYYFKMEYEVLSTQSYTTIYEEYAEDNEEGYRDGQTITSPYKGYTVQTYKLKYDKETDELISKDKDQVSKYKKRDKVVCKIVTVPVETQPPAPKPTDPPATQAPAPTTPPATQAPAPTTPPATTPPATTPSATNPPEAQTGETAGA